MFREPSGGVCSVSLEEEIRVRLKMQIFSEAIHIVAQSLRPHAVLDPCENIVHVFNCPISCCSCVPDGLCNFCITEI